MMLVALGVAAVAYHYFQKLTTPLHPDSQESVVFELREGMLGSDVSRALVEQGLIADEFSFRMLLRFHPRGRDLKIGAFALKPSRPPLGLFDDLLEGKPLTRKATFPEGLLIPEMAAIAKKASLLKDAGKFVKMARTQGKDYGEVFPANMEGYLLPDTYEFPYHCDEAVVLQRFVDEFRGRVLPLWEKKKAKSPLKDLREVVVLASLVEREAQVDGERGLIAGVYINRLKLGMRLECDATVQFALGKTKPVLLFVDLEVDSPYNTYKYTGLPPGPIANPGLRSLEAAMAPTPSKYLYYVRNDIKNDGSHVFGKTYAEHLNNCARYQK